MPIFFPPRGRWPCHVTSLTEAAAIKLWPCVAKRAALPTLVDASVLAGCLLMPNPKTPAPRSQRLRIHYSHQAPCHVRKICTSCSGPGPMDMAHRCISSRLPRLQPQQTQSVWPFSLQAFQLSRLAAPKKPARYASVTGTALYGLLVASRNSIIEIGMPFSPPVYRATAWCQRSFTVSVIAMQGATCSVKCLTAWHIRHRYQKRHYPHLRQSRIDARANCTLVCAYNELGRVYKTHEPRSSRSCICQ